jgi:ribosomal protein S18 acetylase RimI-like enzyme
MASDAAIRQMTPGDVDRLVEIALVAWEPVFDSFHRVLGDELFALRWPDWQAEKSGQIIGMCDDDRGDVLVADVDGEVVGFVSFYPHGSQRGIAEIGNNAVHPDHQNRGVAQAMYAEVMNRLRAAGVEYVADSHLKCNRPREQEDIVVGIR